MRRALCLISFIALLPAAGCATTGGRLGPVGEATGEAAGAAPGEAPGVGVGVASYYHAKFHGRPTASGEIYDEEALTAAHPTLPFGTRVAVTNLANRRSVVVRINDRGPFARGRLIDLSLRAARELGFLRAGTTRVRLDLLAD